ncbi:zinc finger BED domain-containing protein RICESLEEPER 2 [Tanacetum coccineum]
MKDNNRDGEGCSTGTLQNWKYDEKSIKSSLIELIVLAELPFKFVEHPEFIKYSKNLQPKYNLPSRHTISRDVAKFYLEEKEKPVKFLGNPNHTIHLTIDTWTSTCQKINYMVITAHFIDDYWVMHKRVINFKRINSHRGKDIGRVLLKCINGWGIKNVMTITVDNITSNDRALKYLIEHLPSMYDNGKHFHIRCMAHIINLVVKDGLKVHATKVETIGLAVKYIISSSKQIEKFKGCIKNTCDSNRFLIAECPMRWNSTYDMLKSAIDLQDAFYNYSMKNASFSRDLNAIPHRTDFDVCQKVCNFLEKLEKTELVSTQTSPVGHLFYSEILDINKHLREWELVPKFDKMVSKMRLKYDKHLMENGCIPEENEDEVDTPMEFLTDIEKEDKVKELVYEVETNMGVLFALYNEKYGTKLTNNSSDVQKSSSTQSSNTTRRRGNTFLNSFKSQNPSRSSGVEDELKKYLKEPILELDDEEDFDILSWWKLVIEVTKHPQWPPTRGRVVSKTYDDFFPLIRRLTLDAPLTIFYNNPSVPMTVGLKSVGNDEQLNDFVQALFENDCRLNMYTEHQGYDVLEMVQDDNLCEDKSDSDFEDVEKNESLEDLKDVINLKTEGEDNVVILKLATDDHWLNKLVGKGKFVGEMENPTPDLHDRFMVEENDHDEKYKDPKYKLWYMQNDSLKLLVKCGRDVDAGKCAGKRGKKQQPKDQIVPTKYAGNKGKEQLGVKGKEKVGEKGKEPSYGLAGWVAHHYAREIIDNPWISYKYMQNSIREKFLINEHVELIDMEVLKETLRAEREEKAMVEEILRKQFKYSEQEKQEPNPIPLVIPNSEDIPTHESHVVKKTTEKRRRLGGRPEEEPEEEPEEQEQEEMEIDDEIDDAELIFPYEAPDSPRPPPPEFPSSIHVRGRSPSAAPVAYDLEDPMPSYIRRDIDSLDGRVRVLARQMGTREAEKALAQSRDRVLHIRLDVIDFDRGVVEHRDDKIENVVVTLDDRVRKLEQYGVGEENQRLKKKLKSKEMSETFLRWDRARVERDFYEMRAWAYGFYHEMFRVRAVREERPSEAVDVLATFRETPPPEPRGSPRDSQIMPPRRMSNTAIEQLINERVAKDLADDRAARENAEGPAKGAGGPT